MKRIKTLASFESVDATASGSEEPEAEQSNDQYPELEGHAGVGSRSAI